ncbi:MAG: hypothetical protein IPG64_04210 [Haliea sp.]|nr:hypothetical protein [Haliea sp.]
MKRAIEDIWQQYQTGRQMAKSVTQASVGARAAIIGDQNAVYRERKGHWSTTAAVFGAARDLLTWLRFIPVSARLSMLIGYIRSGGDSEHVGRYYDCANTQYAEDDEYHIHDNKRLIGQKYRKCK